MLKNLAWLAAVGLIGSMGYLLVRFPQQGSIRDSQKFDPALVAEKQKCQVALDKWSQEYNADGLDIGVRAHFNAELNTCLVRYQFINKQDQSSMQVIADIYDSKRKILELDVLPNGTPPGLFDHGQQIKTNAPGGEFFKRSGALFEEEPSPNIQ